jgi:hypothetical protein
LKNNIKEETSRKEEQLYLSSVHNGSLLNLLFDSDDGGDNALGNVGLLYSSTMAISSLAYN